MDVKPETRLGIAYGSISFFSALLHNLFLLYHVETFVSIYKIDKTSFWIGETIFLIWNSMNDPLFGWISDKKFLSSQEKTSESDVVLSRIKALSRAGPLFALSFLTFWVSWLNPSLQFVLCLCLYDGFLTMLDLHHSALLADLAVSAKTRTELNFYCSFFSGIGSLSVFLSYLMWDKENLMTFRIFCVVLVVVSVIGFWFGSVIMRKSYIKYIKSTNQVHSSEAAAEKDHDNSTMDKAVVKTFVKDLAGHKNFLWFSAMNIVQVFHCHFNSNFFPLFLESLLGDEVSPTVCSILLGVSFVAPHINNLYFLGLCRRYGVYNIIQFLFLLKLFLSVCMVFVGPNQVFLLCLFIASNRVFTEGTCKLLTLVITDLVDEDFVIHKRKQAVSALIFGTSALLSKPGQTFAPLIGTWLLAIYTGHDVFASGNEIGSIKLSLETMPFVAKEAYKLGVFHLLVYIPTVCAILQLLAWSQFSLHGKRLQWIKSFREGAQYSTV